MACKDNTYAAKEEVCKLADQKDAWQDHEEKAVADMATLARQIRRRQDGQIDVASRASRDVARNLLESVGSVVRMLQVQLAPQTYKQSICERILSQWTEVEKPYSIRVLVASVQHWENVVVNNQAFRLSGEAARLSLKLCRSWAAIGLMLRKIRKQGPSAIPRSTAVATLEAFDRSWAAFEHKLLSEVQVMHIQAQDPRAPLLRATELVCNLERVQQRFDLETQLDELVQDPEYQEQHRLLVETISHLNLLANKKNRGYGFTAQTLNDLEAVIEQCERNQPDPQAQAQDPSFFLAVEAVEAFNSLCAYFYHVKDRMDCVDPILSNNKGLVERLAQWETSWWRAEDHVLDPLGRRALETLMASIRKAQTLSPELVEMCEECSADMFLALPRLVWLGFLASPLDLAPELQCLMRHRFLEVQDANGQLGCCPGDELKQLLEEYGRVLDAIASGISSEALEDPAAPASVLAGGLEEVRRERAAGLLSRSAVLGSGGDLEKCETILAPGAEGLKAREACETFVRSLESWSMELQRHSARDWNTFVAVVVGCLSTNLRPVGEKDPFQV